MAAGDKIYIADKQTLDDVSTKVGSTNNTGGTATAGTLFAKLNAIISSIASHVANWTTARAAKVDNLDASVSSRQSEANALSRYNQLNTNTGVNNTASATGTLSQKLSHAINTVNTRQSETDAASRYNTLNANTGVNNTASATGTLSQKLSHIINLFSTNKQKVLVSKTVGVSINTSGIHTIVNVTGAGQLFMVYMVGMGANNSAVTVEIDGVPYVFRDYSGNSYYIAQTTQSFSQLLVASTGLGTWMPVHFNKSLKISVNLHDAYDRSLSAKYALFE